MRSGIASILAAVFGALACAAQAQVTFLNYNIGTPNVVVFNDRIGNSRFFNGPNTDRVRVSTFVTPSPDSDAFAGANAQGLLFQSLNGAFTTVSATHSNFGTLPNPRWLTWIGLTSGFGGGRNEYTTSFDRANVAVAPLLDAWDATPFSITVNNPLAPSGITSVTVAAPDYDKTAMPSFVTDLSLTGGGLNPRLDWVIPADTVPTALTIQIRRIDAESADGSHITQATLVHNKSLPATATTYTINELFSNASLPGFPAGLEVGKKYEISVQIDQSINGSLKGRSRTLFEFSPLSVSTSNVAVFLPSVGTNGAFKFNVAVNANDTIVIDPAIAVGYIYEVGSGNPNFRSVSLPNVGDGQYVIDVFDAGLGQYRPGFAALAGKIYDFVVLGYPGGAAKFRVKGIEASAALDASNATAFLTTVGFMGAGRFTGTMVPITTYAASGFLPPVNATPTLTTTRAGSTLPLKWTLADKQGFAVSDLNAVASIAYKPSSCSAFSTDPANSLGAQAAGGSPLRYDALANQYVYNWQTPKEPGCYALFVTLDTQQVLSASVMLTQ
jgi:hypothetical protein